jgi:hypothetical protein
MKKFLNPHCFMLNSLAMGDVIAAVPVIKHMIENYYTEPGSYVVVAKKMFRSFFHFVPDRYFRDFDNKGTNWGVPANYSMSLLNTPKSTFNRNTPKHMHLGVFASIKLADRILDEQCLRYVPLKKVDVSHFKIDFSKTVIFVSTYRDETRSWHADSMLEVAAYVRSKGFMPVFIGRTEMNLDTALKPKTSLPDNVDEYGIDLRNKTSIEELASLSGKAKAVVGMDSGPIHLAGTTSVPIVCAFTSIYPEHRVPYRKEGAFYSVTADIPCIGCESDWESHYWNFENCYLKTNDCCNKLEASKFIEQLKKILE